MALQRPHLNIVKAAWDYRKRQKTLSQPTSQMHCAKGWIHPYYLQTLLLLLNVGVSKCCHQFNLGSLNNAREVLYFLLSYLSVLYKYLNIAHTF